MREFYGNYTLCAGSGIRSLVQLPQNLVQHFRRIALICFGYGFINRSKVRRADGSHLHSLAIVYFVACALYSAGV